MIILITGPESTGKSTLAQAIAEHTNCVCLSEYARTYLEQKKDPKYQIQDLENIALEHQRLFESILQNEINIVLDTYLLNIKIWSDYKFGFTSQSIIKQLSSFKPDLTLLMKPDIPWVSDDLRENENDRDQLFDLFEAELKLRKDNYTVISGVNRFEKALGHLIQLGVKVDGS